MGDTDYGMPDYGSSFEGEPHLLNTRITSSGISLGNTADGRAFVLKALDPSVDGVEVKGIPDITTDDVGVEKYRSFLPIQAPALASGANGSDTYNYMIRLTGNPIAPFDVYITSAYLATQTNAWCNSFTYINPQIPSSIPAPNYFSGGTTAAFAARQAATTAVFNDKLATFLNQYQSIRGLWGSVSIKQMAASLSDQGFIVAAQQDAIPTIQQSVSAVTGYNTQVNTTYVYKTNDFPDANSIYALDRCYTGQSRDGVYMPVHLDNEFAAWKNMQDPIYINSPDMVDITGSTSHVPSVFATLLTRSTDVTTISGSPAPAYTNIKPMFRNLGTIYINGVAPGTTFQLMWRGGYEGLPFSSSLESTHTHPSPKEDPQAMSALSQIVRQHLMFAYPVSWNDGGGLLNWIVDKVKDAGSWVRDNILPTGLQALIGGIEGGPAGAAEAAARYAGRKALGDFGKYAGLTAVSGGRYGDSRPVSAVRQHRMDTAGRNGIQRRIEFV